MSDTVFELDGTILTAKPSEALDSMTSPVFESELRAHLAGITGLIVDMAQVDYISSAGLRAFLAVRLTLEDAGADMKLIHVKDYIMEVFEMVGFLEAVTVE